MLPRCVMEHKVFLKRFYDSSACFFKMKRDGALWGVHRMCPIKLSFCLLIRVDAPYWYLKVCQEKDGTSVTKMSGWIWNIREFRSKENLGLNFWLALCQLWVLREITLFLWTTHYLTYEVSLIFSTLSITEHSRLANTRAFDLPRTFGAEVSTF